MQILWTQDSSVEVKVSWPDSVAIVKIISIPCVLIRHKNMLLYYDNQANICSNSPFEVPPGVCNDPQFSQIKWAP